MKQNPWLGLATYDETLISKGYKFCGRERAINELYSIIDNNIITTLYGKSGIGKSSLMQAGIFPLCRYNNYLPVMIRLGVGNNSTSASSYIDTVIASVEQCIQAINGTIQKSNNNTSTVQDTEKLWHYFHSSQFRNSNNDVIFPVIVLDQFEELYYRDRDQLNTLLKSIYLLLDDSSINGNSDTSQIINYRIVISIREDDLFHLEDSIDKLRLAEMKDNRYRLRDFSEEEAFNVITVPGNDVFDKDDINSIANLIIKESKANSTEISSAILSLICSRIFSSVKENRLITLNDVNLFFKDAQGNFLKSFYEDIRKNLTPAQWYFIEDELVTDDGRRDSVPKSEFDKVFPDSQQCFEGEHSNDELLNLSSLPKKHWLFEGEHSMLRKVTIQGSSEPRIEIIHDTLAKQMLSSKKERKLQEQARKLRRQRLTAFTIIAVIVALGIFILQYRSIIEERNNMYKMQSHYITEKAERLIETGDISTAITLLLNVLPENIEKPNRPYIEEAEYALRKANDIYNSSKFQFIKRFKHSDEVTFSEFYPNGKYLITASDNYVTKWEIKTGEQVQKGLKHKGKINSVQFSPNREYIVTTSDSIAKIWDAKTGKQVEETLEHYNDVNYASFSPDGKFIITVSDDNTAKIWHTKTGIQVRKLKHNDLVNSASFSPDGKFIVTASDDNTAQIWNAETGEQVGETLKHSNDINSASFSPNGKFIVTASDDETAKIWNTETGKQVGDTLKHDGSVKSASFSPDGKFIVTASRDKTAKIWNAKTGEQVGETLKHNNDVNSAQFSRDGKFIVTASRDKTAKIWNAEMSKQVGETLKHFKHVNSASFSPDGKYIVTASFNTAKIWSVESGKQVGKTLMHDTEVFFASFSHDGKFIITVSDDNTAKIWNTKTGKQVRELKHNGLVNSASFSPDGKFIVTASCDKTARIWNTKTGKQVGETLKHDSWVNSASFSSDGKFIVTASDDNTAKIWNTQTGEQVGETLKHDAYVNSASFSPDGKYIVTSSYDNTAKIWNVKTGEQVVVTLKHEGIVCSASFSPDGKFIVTTSLDNTAKIWNAETGKQIGETLKHDSWVKSASFSPDGKFIVTESSDKTTKIWYAETGKLVGKILNYENRVISTSSSPDGKYIVTATRDGTVKITEFIPLQDLIDRYKKLFGDWSLTEEELKEYNFK